MDLTPREVTSTDLTPGLGSLLCRESNYGIDARHPPRRKEARDEARRRQRHRHGHEHDDVPWIHVVQDRLQRPRGAQRERQTEEEADDQLDDALPHDQDNELAALRAERG